MPLLTAAHLANEPDLPELTYSQPVVDETSCARPATARIWNTGTAATHCSPSSTGTSCWDTTARTATSGIPT